MPDFFANNHRFRLFLISLFFISSGVTSRSNAQTWPWLTPFSGTGSETISGLATRTDDGPLVCGHFRNELSVGNISETATGNTDVFLAALNITGQPEWILTGTGAGADKSTEVETDSANNIYWAGEFWFDGTFGTLNLSATKSSKAIFLIKVSGAGTVDWGRSIEGTGNKTLGAMTTDAAGNSYLSGNFSDSLFIENTILTATAEKDFFILKFSPSGDLLWTRQAGIAGEIQPRRMRWQNELIAITGSMRGRFGFETDTIQNNTNDSDAFLVVYDPDGNVNWARKIGGVNEQAGSDIAFDAEDNIYAVGSFFGVIPLRADLQIQSPNLNDNLYFIKYTPTGFPVTARSIGGLEIELSESLIFREDRFFWSGFFKNNFSVDGFDLVAVGANFNSFILEIDTSATVVNTTVITSDENVLLSELAVDATGRIFGGGALNGSAQFNATTTLTAADGFDSFVGQLTPLIVGTTQLSELSVKLYPNPANNYFQIETAIDDLEIQVFTMYGKEVIRTKARWINCQNWPTGIYIVTGNGIAIGLLTK